MGVFAWIPPMIHSGCGPPSPTKAHCAHTKIQISQLWGLIENWGFRVDLPLDPPDDPRWWWTPPLKAHCAKTKIQISQLWDLIDTWGFHVHLPLDPPHERRWRWTTWDPPPKAHCAQTKNQISQ